MPEPSPRSKVNKYGAKALGKLGRLFPRGNSTAGVIPTSTSTNSLPPPTPNPGSSLQRTQSSPPSPSALANQPLLTADAAHHAAAALNGGSAVTSELPSSSTSLPPSSGTGGETTTRKDRIAPALDVLSQVLKAATAAAAVFPPAGAVVGGINTVVDTAKTAHQNKVDRKAVKKNLEEAGKRLERCKGIETLSNEMSDRILKLESDLKADIGSIDEAINESWWRRWSEGNAQETSKHYEKLSSMLSLFITETIIDMDGRIDTLSNMAKELKLMTQKNYVAISQVQADEKFKQLIEAKKVKYDAGPPDLRGRCTPKTREQILADLMAWATDDTNTQVYWLSGMAGTGKTTIAYSFCELLESADLLCTSYFCSRTVKDSMDPRAILPAISFHLASYFQPFGQALLDGLRNPVNADIQQKELQKQFHTLILEPAKALSMSEILKRRVVVYDGADEAADLKEVAKLIGLFLENAGNLPFKIFISSRRDDFIKSEFERESLAAHSALLLHDVEESLVEADIRLYMHERLNRVSGLVAEEDISALVERSGKLFVYAAVLCSFVDLGKKGGAQARLRAIMDSSSKSIPGTKKRPHDALDQIYREILSIAEQDSPDIWPVLLVILTTRNPLTVRGIAHVLGFEEFQVSNVSTSLHAVLTGSDSEDHPVTIFHTSFRDFLIDKSRGRAYGDLISKPHKNLTARCLEIMKVHLIKDNICMIKSKEIPRSDIESSEIREFISVALEYSCTSWLLHLMELDEEQQASYEKDVLRFFDELILRWTECMAWLGSLEDAVRSLQRVEISQQSSADLRFAAMDVRRLVLQCFEVIRDYPLEVYHSALVWLPHSSRISQRFKWQDWKVTRGVSQAWDARENTLVGHSKSVLSVCFSQDGKKIISGSLDSTVRIWNVETSEEERTLEGHSGEVLSVVISRDGRRVVSGSSDNTVRIWNVETGKEERKLEGHSDQVQSVAISPDGRRVISGSEDQTVRIWNVETGEEERKLEGHLGWVLSVAISYDGKRIVSGSADQTVRIWYFETGEEEKKLEGHADRVWSVAISHDGRRIISGSEDKTVRIWDVETGREERKLEGHSDSVWSVAISHDGKRVISGSQDKTVWIWNLETGKEERKLEGHSNCVWSVAMSHDGKKAISGSQDKTVWIWNVETGEEERKPKGHSGRVWSVAISHDSRKIVSGSSDNTVRVWNVETGEEERKLEGHSGWVLSVAISHDGKRVVSGSSDKTVRVWNAETGEEERKLVGPLAVGGVRLVAISHDGRSIASRFWHSDTIHILTVGTDDKEEMTSSAFANRLDFKSSSSASSVTYESGWLRCTPTSPRLWVLSHSQNFYVSASSAQVISFGYINGDIIIVQCAKPQ